MKNKFILAFALLLIIVAGVIYFSRKKGSIDQELKDFAVKDTSTIDKVFLADMAGNSVTVERVSASKWQVNKKYPARQDVVNTLLYTISRLEVKSPVAKAAHNSVVGQLASSSIKIEIFKNGELAKTYYVGGPTQNHLGTFMLLDKSSAPFIMHIPGFDGYLTTRYTTKEDDWRERVILSYPVGTIHTLKISYPFHPEFSFEMDVEKRIATSERSPKKVELKQSKLNSYLYLFKKVPFENWERTITDHKRDSILASSPVSKMILTDKKGKANEVKIFLKMKVNETGELVDDPDRLYAQLNDQKELLIIQHFVFDNLLATFKDFEKARP